MNERTRSQLLAVSEAFYRAHAGAFDASRGDHAWPGWQCLPDWLRAPAGDSTSNAEGRPAESAFTVLDIGCGNARLGRFLGEAGFRLRYTGVDANADLLAAAGRRLAGSARIECQLLRQDFLASESPGAELPTGPFALVALMGVLHHVPGRDWRLGLLRAAAQRLVSGGILALATWQFAGRDRFERRCVEWSDLGPVLGAELDPRELEDGDRLLRFGDDPNTPPRYCHQVADAEFESWPSQLGLEKLADYRADGAEGDLNRYWILRRS